MNLNQSIGKQGEETATKFLKNNGYKIIERNWHNPHWGEIDIIATEGKFLVFVEVKTRTSDKYGHGEEAVNFYKLRALKRTANYYISTIANHQDFPGAYRIDVVVVDLSGIKPKIELFKNVPS